MKVEVGYIVNPKNANAVAFIPDSEAKSRWLRVHPSVVMVACPQCKAERGKPCVGELGVWRATVHHMRNDAGKFWRVSEKTVPGVVVLLENL